ncbi:MAG: Na+/H+ antiporter subunit E [Luteolibacter sp.]
MKLIHLIVFVLIYLWEVIYSTWKLAILVLHPRPKIDPCFVELPMDLRGELPQFLFACLISMTPGTMSVSLNREQQTLTVHVLNAPEPRAAVAEMKRTFEKPLIRIFGEA